MRVENEPAPRWWCNFCGFRTDDEQAYLAHSCREELARKQSPPPDVGTERHCR
jgi:hypothetical protein